MDQTEGGEQMKQPGIPDPLLEPLQSHARLINIQAAFAGGGAAESKNRAWYMQGSVRLRRVWLVVVMLLCVGCTPLAGGGRLFIVSTDRPDNQVDLTVAGDTAYFTIESESGIGEATVQWVAGLPLERIILRFHLRGLEGLRLVYGDTAVHLSLSSVDGGQVIQTVAPAHAQDVEDRPITPESDDWLPTKIVPISGEEQPSLPLENGYIEVQLPLRFLIERHTGFSVRWIDFYR